MAESLWKWWLAAGAAITALYMAIPGGALSDVLYVGTATSAVAGILLGVRRFRPRARAPWYWLAAGHALMVVAEITWLVLDRLDLPPFPSIADLLFLTAYPCVAVALTLIVRHRTATREVASLLDAAVVAIGVTVVTWVLVLGPTLADVEATALERAVSAAYPVLDLLLVVVVARLAFGGGAGNVSFLLLTAGLILTLVADVRYLFEELSGTYTQFGLVDGAWMAGYLLIGAASVHPSMAALTDPHERSDERLTVPRLAALMAASVTAPLMLLVQWLRGAPLEVPVVTTGATAMFVLVVLRVSQLGRLVVQTRARGEARFRSLVHHATDVILVLDGDGAITYASPALQRVWQYRVTDMRGRRFGDLLHPEDVGAFEECVATLLAGEAGASTTFEGRLWSPTLRWRSFEATMVNLLPDPTVAGVVLTCRDTTERTQLQRQLTHQAYHDPLTDLANRSLFHERVQQALDDAGGGDGTVAVLFIDLDDFKAVNDALGHGAGDAVLLEVGARLASALGPGDVPARLGGDEFAVLIPDAPDRATVTETAQRLITALQQPLQHDDTAIEVKASVGIATSETAGSAQQLISDADIAMYDAKTAGKGRFSWFAPAMRDRAVDRWTLRTDLAFALRHDELVVEYQPIFDLATGAIAGAEALVRWQHPERGTIGPADFIPIAEETGLINEIGEWVLHTAVSEAARWHTDEATAIPLYVSVNVSALQLRDDRMIERVASVLSTSGVPPRALTLELTESLLMDDVEVTRAVLQELRDLGVSVAVDDFGTGYSSLAYLRQFPVNVLKIDRSFISELGTRPEARTLAADIVTLADALGVTSVAEGIETHEQLALLRSMGCSLGQGYLLGRPVTAGELERRLRQRRAATPVQP